MAKAAIIGGAFYLCLVLAIVWPSWAITLKYIWPDGIVFVAWLMAAWGIGWPIVWKVLGKDDQHSALRIATAAAIGLGLISLITLGLGLAGLLNYYTAWAIICVGLALAAGKIWAHNAELEAWLNRPAESTWSWMVALVPASVITVATLVPPGILWGGEPNGYDVVEYHLQVPRQWYEAKKITPLKENVFSYFPQGVEMHYLLAMELREGPWEGMYLAQFMHAGFFLLAAMAIGGVSTWAGIIFAVTPWTVLLAPIAYVEGGVLLYGSLAMIWAMRGAGPRRAIIAGTMAGFSCGVKLPDVAMVLCAIPAAWAIADRHNWLKRTAIFFAAGLAVFLPWLIRTGVWAGNPVFPEAMKVLGHAHFSAVQVERWQRAYWPTTGRWQGLWEQVLADRRFGYVLLPAAVIAGLLKFKSIQSRFLLSMLLVIGTIWFGFTHLQSRFFVLAIPICAMLIAQVKLPRVMPTMLILFLLGLQMTVVGPLEDILRFDQKMFHDAGANILGRKNLLGIHGLESWPEERMDLIGDAEVFFFQVPESQITYRTVFDVDSSDKTKSIVEDWLGGPDTSDASRRLVINPDELRRLTRTYYGFPEVSDEDLNALSKRRGIIWISPN
jgi:hypothetical protein